MKKNFWTLLLFILIGLLAGTLVSYWLQSVPGLAFLTRTKEINWSPAADLLVASYDLTIRIDISLLSIAGLVLAIWLYRRM
ncbi:DUF4321 domain-containing protein [Paenibacillus sp. GCM10027626]|uniref:DUF4321 domain-containing protein n=1 Tax=Paenibacillus sp. GCM10027626 TaxID=3273411 RepID=UPI00362B7C8F